ncbi:MDR family MFS transporter [Sphaerisporangium sp. NPDC051017]|uniref:MDR family MFS transporter n=1 Tax=Sphaerisporangium sp. NPDC051017 TaxID=3154636 RepID=UPI00344526BF
MSETEAEIVPGRRREVMVVLPGLMLAIMLAMLDNMIVGTAMPRIVGELGGLAHLSWLVTAYVLGTSVSTPIWGKIGDLYGRKTIFLASIAIFMVGSALCGMAGSDIFGGTSGGMGELIAFRAIQGLGAGGLMVNAMAIIGDLVPPRERGRYQGIMAAIMALAMVAGPLVGGFITDNLNWRWAFYVNLPIGAVAFVWLLLRLHLPKYRTEHRIDWLGAALLGVGITALVLITTWGGTEYAWGSWQILGLVAVAVVSLAIFIPVQRRVAEPIMPLHVFRDRNFTLVSLVGFLLGFAMFGAINFLPLFQQTVQGASATNSGLLLLPMMAGMMAVSLVAGQAITRTGKYKVWPLAGGVVMVVGMWLLSLQDVNTTTWQTGLFIAVLGLGMGGLMQTTMLIAQNSVEQKDLGVASSAATFFRSIGGSFGVSLFGAIFNHHLTSNLTDRLGPQAAQMAQGGNSARLDPTALAALPAQVREGFLSSLADSISSVFFWAIFISILVPVFAAFIKQIPLRSGPAAPGSAPKDGTGDVAKDAMPVAAFD